ncbi:MAG: NYN domain-containing protein [Ornithinibacter sp.]
MDTQGQIALLIDADNARATRIELILGELSTLGETNIRRAYGNWTKAGLKSWQDVLHENAIRPVQQFDQSKGKNASDIALAVDAVEILHTQRPDAFALVSSDADFTPLVMHLREHGARVYGFGDAKTPAPFQSACTRFLVLDRLSSDGETATASVPGVEESAPPSNGRARKASAPVTAPATAGTTTKAAAKKAPSKKAAAAAPSATPQRATRAQLRGDNKLVSLLRRAVESAADDAGWALVGTVGNRISNQSSFDSRNYGYAKLSKLLEATDLFDIKDSGASGMAVRDRRQGVGGSTSGAPGGNEGA